jgi:hypothetical protein
VPPHWFDSDLWTFVQADDLKVVDEAPTCDVLFIDTTHGYQQTWNELLNYAPKVRTGGVILLHDTELERPELSPHDDPFPVRRATEEFLALGLLGLLGADFDVEWVPGCNGLAVIRVKR